MLDAEPPIFHIFGDETSQTGHHYLVYGTVDCPREELPAITDLLGATLKDRREFKWSGQLTRDLDRFVEAIFACRAKHRLSFRCMVVNTRHSDHRTYNQGDAYLGLEKYIFFHLLGYARRQHADSNAHFCVTLDKLKDKHTFDGLRSALNFRAQSELHRRDVFSDVIGVESHTQVLVQAADVLAGCVAWVWNEHYKNSPDPDRIALATKIANLANLYLTDPARHAGVTRRDYRNFGYPTYRTFEEGFAIWEMYLRTANEAELRAKSAAQLAMFAPETTFDDLKRDRYKVEIRCLRCDRKVLDLLAVNPGFGRRKVNSRFRPKCGKCLVRSGVLLLRPDPLRKRPHAVIDPASV